MKYCQFCGTQCTDESKFCHRCGKPFYVSPISPPVNSVGNQYRSVEQFTSWIVDGAEYEQRYLYRQNIIVGMQYYGNIPLYYNEKVFFELEPTNEYDNKAIKVKVLRNGQPVHIGYIAKTANCRDITYDYLKKGNPIMARVDDNTKCTFVAGYYLPARNYDNYYQNQKPVKEFRVSIRDADEYEFEIGDIVEYDYDYDKDRELLNVGYYDVKAPAASLNYNDVDKYILFITDVYDTETGASVSISVYKIAK